MATPVKPEQTMDTEDLYPPQRKISRPASLTLVLALSVVLWLVILLVIG